MRPANQRARRVNITLTDYHLELVDENETNRSEAIRRLIEQEYGGED